MLVINIGDTVITKKPHPCGQNSWTVIRTGADVKLKCNGLRPSGHAGQAAM